MTTHVLTRLANRWSTRSERERLCAYGTKPGELSEPRCEILIAPRASRVLGHYGYCSHEHDRLAQEDAIF